MPTLVLPARELNGLFASLGCSESADSRVPVRQGQQKSISSTSRSSPQLSKSASSVDPTPDELPARLGDVCSPDGAGCTVGQTGQTNKAERPNSLRGLVSLGEIGSRSAQRLREDLARWPDGDEEKTVSEEEI
ncbi:unnamed protein product [Protopolystoma xenopodis]|uniref:Uncharacterized protein n=1 Tax=Protopolystoma xenopodis TaxID=117903 RepID=A0A3S5BR33_9PLAT|nr:unnamed protein product [Protopolystoma xenopodis]